MPGEKTDADGHSYRDGCCGYAEDYGNAQKAGEVER